jgi:hypothetical protein
MDNTILIDAGDKRFLYDVIKELPENTMLNKRMVGCGATSVAFRSKFNTVIVVPYRSIITNKLKWCIEEGIECIGIYSDPYNMHAHSIEALREFKGDKIIVTYDSLYKLEQVIDPSEWNIVIDECHKLIDSAALRFKAIRSVLANYKKYRSFCFLTATPVPDEYQLPELLGIQKAEIIWHNLEEVLINYISLEKGLYETSALIALQHLKGEKTGNAHIFINSVKGICKIVEYLKNNVSNLNKDVRIVCADNSFNNDYIQDTLGTDYFIEPNTTLAKTINFYTSTCFEGSDLFDEEGVSYIVTDGSLDHTKVNILTTLPQIASRIRNSRYKNKITLIFTSNAFATYTTEKEYCEYVKSELAKYSKSVIDFKNVDHTTQRFIIKGSLECQYVIDEDDELFLNEEVMYNEMFNYRTIHQTYYVAKGEQPKETYFMHNTIDYHYVPNVGPVITGLNKVKLGKKANFSDLCIEYIALKANPYGIGADKIESLYQLIKEAFVQLGPNKMKALKFQRSDIQRELIKVNALKSNHWKISQLLGYRVGQWLAIHKIKEDLIRVYKELEIDSTPKGTDLHKLYELKQHIKTIDRKRVVGFKVISPKIKFAQKDI